MIDNLYLRLVRGRDTLFTCSIIGTLAPWVPATLLVCGWIGVFRVGLFLLIHTFYLGIAE